MRSSMAMARTTVVPSREIKIPFLYNVELTVELITPVALEKGLRFAIREGGRTVGAGTISEIIK